MFTLCMSRGHPPLQDAQHYNNISNKQVKGGYLLRYRRGFFCNSWSEEWFVLYEDSTLAWYADKGLSRPRGRIRISEAPELLAIGEWTRQVPKKPRFPRSCHIGQLLVIGTRTHHNVHWLMAQSPAEVNDWMTAISNTLPPPPHLPLDNKRHTLLQKRDMHSHQEHSHIANNGNSTNCTNEPIYPSSNKSQNPSYEADHTVLSGVVIDWGHGWGWGQTSSWATQTAACVHESIGPSLYCQAVDDYAVDTYEGVDWSAFADFSF